MDKETLTQILTDHKNWLYDKDRKRADLSGADLSGAHLSGAYLSGAYLSGAYLRGAYLRGADLSRADLRGATYGDGVPMSNAPIQLIGFKYFVLILDSHIKIGCNLQSIEDWLADKNIPAKDFADWQMRKPALIAVLKAAGRM